MHRGLQGDECSRLWIRYTPHGPFDVAPFSMAPSYRGEIAAIDRQALACNVGRCRRAQENGGAHEVVEPAKSRLWDLGEHGVLPALVSIEAEPREVDLRRRRHIATPFMGSSPVRNF